MPMSEEGLLNKPNGLRKGDCYHLLICTVKRNILMSEINVLNQIPVYR